MGNLLTGLALRFARAGRPINEKYLQSVAEDLRDKKRDPAFLYEPHSDATTENNLARYHDIARKFITGQPKQKTRFTLIKEGRYDEFLEKFSFWHPDENICLQQIETAASRGASDFTTHFINLSQNKEKAITLAYNAALNKDQFHLLLDLYPLTHAFVPNLKPWLNLGPKTKLYQKFYDIYSDYAQSNSVLPEYFSGIEDWKLFHLRMGPYLAIRRIFEEECPDIKQINTLAARATMIFQSPERLLRFFEKYGAAEKAGDTSPLSTLISKIYAPISNDVNWPQWGDALLKFGPQMFYPLQYAVMLYEPSKNHHGEISLRLTKRQVWHDIFSETIQNGAGHPELAKLCFSHEQDFRDYESAFNIWAGRRTSDPRPEKAIPDIDIDCTQIGLPDYRFQKLSYDDYRGLMIGLFTGCCEKIGDFFEDTVMHAYSTRQSGFYVLMKDNEIKAHTWVWRGKHNQLILDGYESLDPRINTDNLVDLTKMVARELSSALYEDYKITDILMGISAKQFDPESSFEPAAIRSERFVCDWYFLNNPNQWLVHRIVKPTLTDGNTTSNILDFDLY